MFTQEAVAGMVGHRPVLRDPTGYPLGHATVAAELVDGQIRLTLHTPAHVAARLAPAFGATVDMNASIGFKPLKWTEDEAGNRHITHAASLLDVEPVGDPPGDCPHRLNHTYFGELRCRKRAGHVDGLGTGAVTHEAHVGPGYNDLIRWVTWNTLNLADPNRGRCNYPPDTRGDACNGTCHAKETRP